MKYILLIAISTFSMNSMADTQTLVTQDSAKIAALLKFYPAFSNQVFSEAAAFGFTPGVRSVKVDFIDFQEEPEFSSCRIELTAEMGVGPMKLSAPKGVSSPFQKYEVPGSCAHAMENPVFDI